MGFLATSHMKLNSQQKLAIRQSIFEHFDAKSVLENFDEEFRDEDYDESLSAINDYVQDLYYYILEAEVSEAAE